jgi:hypothetical protein
MPYRYVARKLKDFVIYRILHVDDTPHRIAFGVAIGIFIAWTPTVGFQMGLTVALAALLRANKAVGVPLAWITNPVTIPPVFGFNYWLGAKLLGHNYDLHQFKGFIAAAMKEGSLLDRLHDLWEAMWTIFWPLWLGSIVVGLALGAISYVAVYYGVVRYRRFWHKHHPRPPWADDQAPAEAKPAQPSDGRTSSR